MAVIQTLYMIKLDMVLLNGHIGAENKLSWITPER